MKKYYYIYSWLFNDWRTDGEKYTSYAEALEIAESVVGIHGIRFRIVLK